MTVTSNVDPLDSIINGNSTNEPDESVNSNKDATAQQGDAGNQVDWEKRYKDSVKGFQDFKNKLEAETAQKIEELKSQFIQKPPEPQVEEVEDLGTAEGWKKHISKTAEEVVKPIQSELAEFKEIQKAKAKKLFISRHPEYADSQKLAAVMEKYNKYRSRPENDADEILEDLEDAWAVENRQSLFEKERLVKRLEADREIDMAEAASAVGSSYERQVTDDYGATEEDKRIARSINKPLKDYMRLKKQLAESEI